MDTVNGRVNTSSSVFEASTKDPLIAITTALPEERYALAFVFRTFERISYALVMESSKPVIVGDAVKNP